MLSAFFSPPRPVRFYSGEICLFVLFILLIVTSPFVFLKFMKPLRRRNPLGYSILHTHTYIYIYTFFFVIFFVDTPRFASIIFNPTRLFEMYYRRGEYKRPHLEARLFAPSFFFLESLGCD